MAKELRYDFPAISDGELWRVGPSLSEAQPGAVVAWEETLYQDTGGDWEKGVWGGEIGRVMLRHYRTEDLSRTIVRAWFVMHNGDTVEFSGLVPGEGSWQGESILGYRGGTGDFAEPEEKELPVNATNPKRWG